MARNLKAAPTYRRSLLIGKQQQKQAEIQSWLDILQSSQKSCLPAAAGTPPLERPTPSSNRPQPPLPSGDPPIPLMDRWQSQMLSYGAKHCQALADPKLSFDTKLAAVYYDAQLVFYQIEDYTGDRNWRNCAARAQGIYRDRYVLPNRGAVPGYWNFGAGLAQSFLRHRDLRSREALLALAANAAYARQSTPTTETADALLSREVAYAIMSYLQAEATGAPRNPRLALLIEQSLGHLNQWFVAQSAPYLQPFMFGLSAQALIEYDERIGDSRILPALINGADRLWERTWVEEAQAFLYVDRPNVLADAMAPSADLNLLIAPLYAWLYRQTGQARFRERGDRIFAGGVAGAWLERGKQFNQNYRWSFAYIRWRTAIAD